MLYQASLLAKASTYRFIAPRNFRVLSAPHSLPRSLSVPVPRFLPGLRPSFATKTTSISTVRMVSTKRKAAALGTAQVPATDSPSAFSATTSNSTIATSLPAAKKPKPNPSLPLHSNGASPYKDSTTEIQHGIVMRTFYPPEMTNERAKMYVAGEIERPIETLDKAIAETRTQREAILKAPRNETGEGKRHCIVFWFKCDLRTKDNRGLSLAASQAAKFGVPLVCMYLVSPQDFSAHLTAPVRVDFILRNLTVLKRDLAELDVPLYVETVEKRRNLPGRLVGLCKDWGARAIYCNIEYEVDELRREAKLTRDFVGEGICFTAVHDTCVVKPGELKSGAGGQISIYSPWHRKWIAYLNSHLKDLEEYARPGRNPETARKMFEEVFESEIPDAPEGKRLSGEEKKKFEGMWPAGEQEAMQRLEKFIAERIGKYHDTRNLPAGNGTSTLSPHLAAGTIAARTVVRMARDAAPRKALTDDRKQGHSMWIGEVAWRDFYKHVLCHWPYICMNKPFKPEYTNIVWEYDMEQFKRWTEGRTGFPIVDAAMRQLKSTGYMHNRCRMIVASFLAKHLLIDWRMGEKWFMEHLIDGDFASNNCGWGFSASCGVDPQPYFRIFNPWLQSEKFDVEGVYIRRWIKELEGVKGKAIHDPYGRGAEAEAKRKGYPRPMVDHKHARERCLERYKAGIGRSTA